MKKMEHGSYPTVALQRRKKSGDRIKMHTKEFTWRKHEEYKLFVRFIFTRELFLH